MAGQGVPAADRRRFRALELESQGRSIGEIADDPEVKASKSTVHGWINDQDLRDRWQQHLGEERARAELLAAVADAEPGADLDGADVEQLRDLPVETDDGGPIPPSVVMALAMAISDGMFEYSDGRYDFGLACDDVGIRREEVKALQIKASRGDEEAWRVVRSLRRTAAATMRSGRRALKTGDKARESWRLFLEQVSPAKTGATGAGGPSASPLAGYTDEQLRDMRARIEGRGA